jgi:hypothetical protein
VGPSGLRLATGVLANEQKNYLQVNYTNRARSVGGNTELVAYSTSKATTPEHSHDDPSSDRASGHCGRFSTRPLRRDKFEIRLFFPNR